MPELTDFCKHYSCWVKDVGEIDGFECNLDCRHCDGIDIDGGEIYSIRTGETVGEVS